MQYENLFLSYLRPEGMSWILDSKSNENGCIYVCMYQGQGQRSIIWMDFGLDTAADKLLIFSLSPVNLSVLNTYYTYITYIYSIIIILRL
jgi:hypothetical protein